LRHIHVERLTDTLDAMRIVVTGASGMLGVDVCAAAAEAGFDVYGLPRAELDIADAGAVGAAISRLSPEVIVNCAAWTDVDGAESEYEDALAVNGTGAGFLARAAADAGAWVVHVSSDYVFDGRATSPYVESDGVAPLSGYGRSKLAGEREVAAAAPDSHTIVRSSWLFGTGGHCFPKTILRIAGERDTITVVDDQVGCPTFTGHLAGALIELCSSRIAGVVHVAGGGECSWFEFATEIVSCADIDCEVRPGSTAATERPAPRPAYSVLRSERGASVPSLPDWHEGLTAFMAARVGAR
jgi:dTDP-4-dehydrorhamnose reductase